MSPADVLRRHLRVKVIALIVAILVLGFGTLLVLNIRREAVVLVASNRETAHLLAASILRSIENGMLEGRPDIVRRLVHDLKGELKDVRHLAVYRQNGVEAFNDLETVNRVNRLAGLDAEMVSRIASMPREPTARTTHPLFARAVSTMALQEAYETGPDGRLLTLFWPVRNVKDCQGCHGEDHQVRGVLQVSLGLEGLDATLRSARNRQIVVALLTILGAAGAMVVLMGRVVLRPIARVASAARQIGAGRLDARVDVTSRDEIGELGRAVNDMAVGLQSARSALEDRNAELAETLRSLQESLRKVELLEQVKGELAKFVPESVKRLLEKNPDARELEKREADVSVLFLDVEGYTRLSEQVPPQRLNRMIQDYFSSFLEIIRANHGDVNETAGDGLMVIFQSEGDPVRHALNATGTAHQIQLRLADLNREFEGVYPRVAIHVGINSGPVLIGATKLDAAGGGRWTFTASGSTTNLAARVAALAKAGEIMAGPQTAERIKGHYVLEDAGEHRLKNVSEPVRVFRLVPPGVYRSVSA